MGNRNSINDRDSSLLNNSQLEGEVSLMVNDQPQMKKIFAIKNPVYLKRNTLRLERDSINKNMNYIVFSYDAVVNVNINIYFNAVRRNENSNIKVNGNTSDLESSKENYIPGKNFRNNILRFRNCNGENVNFKEENAKFDINNFTNNKEELENSSDVVIEIIPIFDDVTSNKKGKDTNEIIFYTMGRLFTDLDQTLKIKVEQQRLFSCNMWFDLYEVFNSALETGECLICCSNIRNTLFLPCKHSCTCQTCAHSLRMRNNPCPICKNVIEDLVIIDTDENK